jgi:excinuclease ABC subunit B
VRKSIRELLETVSERDYYTVPVPETAEAAPESPEALAARIAELEAAMKEAARRLDFERAAELRDRVKALRRTEIGVR